jgi:mono/diheme cytochrome c family protein
MPSFAFLFRDQRGYDLVVYLASLESGDTQRHLAEEKAWQPSAAAVSSANLAEGESLYQRQCATCHDANGRTRLQFQSQFKRPPNSLFAGPFTHQSSAISAADRSDQMARIIKFGIPGTDMPGHEYLSDQQVASLTLFLAQRSSTFNHHP